MNRIKKISVLVLVCLAALLLISPFVPVGCKQKVEPPNNLKEAQDVYQGTSWYWVDCEWKPQGLPGLYPLNTNGSRIFLAASNNESLLKITYIELKPYRGMFSFPGSGTLKELPGFQFPLFELQGGYTADKPDTTIIVGIVRDRMFWVEASGENKEDVFTNACSVAISAFNQLRKQNPK
jgi:hypothetical protein